MRKLTASFAFIAIIIFLASCNDGVSYAERLEREKKRVKQFLNEQNIEVLDTYPKNGVFKSNQYYLDESGVYINVVDSGNGKRASSRSQVYFRFSEVIELPTSESDTIRLWQSSPGLQPFEFLYLIPTSYTDPYSQGPTYAYLSEGVTIPLKHVGENAIVNILVPFKAGSAYQSSAFSTLFYKRLKYTTIINAE
ncbi:MAG TPA: hypothetical protein DIT04_05505 [Dysgonomonas sp.]|nr:hypothetical protein [Dysgonomonas sp.]